MIEERKRQYIILGLIGLVSILALWTIYGFTMTGRLKITAPNDTPNNAPVTVSVIRDNQEDQKVTIQPGQTTTIKLRSGTVRVDAAADIVKAVDIVTVKRFYQTTELTTPTGNNHATKQLASGSLPCPLVAGSVTYSYACYGDGQIVRHQANALGTSLNQAMFDGAAFSLLQPLKDGLIGQYASPNNPGEMLFIDLTAGRVQTLAMPDKVAELLVDNYPVISTAPGDSDRFALSFGRQNKIFVFESVNDSNPRELKIPDTAKTSAAGRTFSAEFYRDELIVYVGVSTDKGEGNGADTTTEETSDINPVLLEYNREGKLTRNLTLTGLAETSTLYKLGDGLYAANTPLNFTFYRLENDALELVYALEDVGDVTLIGDKTYLQANGTIYELAPETKGAFSLHSVFSSKNITAAEIFGNGDTMIFTGFTGNSDASDTNIYELLDKPADATDSNNAAAIEKQNKVEPTYTNLNDLLEYGVSADQVTNLRYALTNYAAQQPEQIKKIEITRIIPQDANPDATTTTLTISFGLLVGGTLREARMDYTDLTTVRLYIMELDGTLLYDSGSITNQQPLEQ
jgi:hypothetical protein